jgi:hypothetical protein
VMGIQGDLSKVPENGPTLLAAERSEPRRGGTIVAPYVSS